MRSRDLADLSQFAAIVRHRSFARAAAELGLSRSALSHAMRGFEERLGVRLLNRTTRSVSPTAAGQRLLSGLQPALDGIGEALDAVNAFRDRPNGHLRLNVSRLAALTVLMPALPRFLDAHPDITVELSIDDATVDIVAQGFDAGIRFSETLSLEMVAVRVGPPVAFAVVGAPEYFARYSVPQRPQDLIDHRCIRYRMRGSGQLYAWEFEKDGQAVSVDVEGGLTLDAPELMTRAALDGFGLTYAGLPVVADLIAEGKLRRVLADWNTATDYFYLYYPSRRHLPAALRALIETIRA
jgi:DNA-binding transcriptional LysR family regulator